MVRATTWQDIVDEDDGDDEEGRVYYLPPWTVDSVILLIGPLKIGDGPSPEGDRP